MRGGEWEEESEGGKRKIRLGNRKIGKQKQMKIKIKIKKLILRLNMSGSCSKVGLMKIIKR